ncbi:MAG: ribose 5-phosphate isomerase B [Ruminococcaceae bacterium]|nr:ribose 5-phosphate isomerase B [Oscillospiraceae bacterium]
MIVIGSDHGAFELKGCLVKYLESKGQEVYDCGVFDTGSVDYPDIAQKVCEKVKSGDYEFGIVLCGTGIGISIAANKIDGIRCALVNNAYSAEKARQHNNANVIAMGGRVLGPDLAINILDAFMNASFEGGRHQNRIDKIHALEK